MNPLEKLAEAAYLELERDSDTKHEFVNGVIVAMAGASMRHGVIAANVLVALRPHLRSSGCRAVGADLRVHIEDTGLYAYPDVTVTCGEPRFLPGVRPDTLLNPRVVVEVLSESTEAWDRGAKAAHYRQIPGLVELVLVSQTERRVEVYRRAEDGWRFFEVAGEGEVVLEGAAGARLPLAEIYEGVDDLPPGA